METFAKHRYARISPQKARLVADQVRGLPVEKALDVLKYSPKKASDLVLKVLESAIANAENNEGADVVQPIVFSVVFHLMFGTENSANYEVFRDRRGCLYVLANLHHPSLQRFHVLSCS